MKVPFFDYPGIYAERRDEYLAAVDDVFARGAFVMQKDLAAFESELSKYLGVRYALGVADGTVALTIALKLAGVEAGDEVIVPSHTFIATAAAVHHCGAIPVLCDCGPDHTIDVESARMMLSQRTKAVMPVQLNGRVSDMDAVTAFATEYGLKIVEDSCQALGAKFRGKPAGTFGVAGSFSFFPAKSLGCFGDGGALVLDDEDLATEAREFRDHGRNSLGAVDRFGHNGRLDNVQAAILRIKLRHYDDAVRRRREIALAYDQGLCDIPELFLPPPPVSDGNHFDIFQNYEIEADRRDELRVYLAERGVGTIMQWGGRVVHQMESLGLRAHAPYAEAMSRKYLLLPLHHLLSDEAVAYVVEGVRQFYGR